MAARRPEFTPQGFILCNNMISIKRIRFYHPHLFYRDFKIMEFYGNATKIHVKIIFNVISESFGTYSPS